MIRSQRERSKKPIDCLGRLNDARVRSLIGLAPFLAAAFLCGCSTSDAGHRSEAAAAMSLASAPLTAFALPTPPAIPEKTGGPLELSSPAFPDGGILPPSYTREGAGISPPLTWENVPAVTRSLALTMSSCSDSGKRHMYMVLYNIPPGVRSLPENDRRTGSRGVNAVRIRPGYTAPGGETTGSGRIAITLYALSTPPDLRPGETGVTMNRLLQVIKGRIVATAVLNARVPVSARPKPASAPSPAQGTLRPAVGRTAGGLLAQAAVHFSGPPRSYPGGTSRDTSRGPASGGAWPRSPDPSGAPTWGRGPGGPGGPGGPPFGPPFERVLASMRLSAAQMAKVAPLLAAHRRDNEKLMAEMRQRRSRLNAALLARMKPLLSRTQYDRLNAALTQRGRRPGTPSGPSGPPPGGGPGDAGGPPPGFPPPGFPPPGFPSPPPGAGPPPDPDVPPLAS